MRTAQIESATESTAVVASGFSRTNPSKRIASIPSTTAGSTSRRSTYVDATPPSIGHTAYSTRNTPASTAVLTSIVMTRRGHTPAARTATNSAPSARSNVR